MTNIDILEEKEKKAIKELTEIKELVEEDLKYKDYNVTAVLDQIDLENLVIVLNLIETLIAENKELKEDNEYLKNQIPIDKIFYYSYKEFIPKSKVKEMIKELEIMYDGLPKNPKEHLHSKTEYKIVIGVLQSLLRKE